MRVMLPISSLLVFAVFAGPLAAAQDAASEQEDNITYREVNGQGLSAYVFRPAMRREGEKSDAVPLFHGGGWSAGTPEWTFGAARRFADWGMVAIAIEYRLSGGDVTPIDAFEDVCEALRWVRHHASDLGLTGRVVGYGVSAGGHLVTATATVGCPGSEIEGDRSAPDALLLWSPALDVAMDGWFENLLQGRAAVSDYSPAEHVRHATPPTSIVIGAEDTLTPLSGARRYCDRLVGLGGVCELNVYDGVGHLLTRNLANQESDFDPDPKAREHGIAQHERFLRELGFIPSR